MKNLLLKLINGDDFGDADIASALEENCRNENTLCEFCPFAGAKSTLEVCQSKDGETILKAIRQKISGQEEENEKWEVVYDGPSMPMISSPGGRLFYLQSLNNGSWGHSPFAEGDTRLFVDALNLYRENNRKKAEG